MSEVSIKGLNDRCIELIKTQYRGIKYNPLVWSAFKKRKVKVEFESGVLKFKTKANKIDKSNLHMVEGFLRSKGFKPKKDYVIEVKK